MKGLEKQEQIMLPPKETGRDNQNQGLTNEIGMKKTRTINEMKNWFFENTYKSDKPLAKLITRKRTQINQVTDQKETSQQTLRKEDLLGIVKKFVFHHT